MAATKFSMIYLNEKTGNVLVNELGGKYTYKMATAIAKEVCERNKDFTNNSSRNYKNVSKWRK